MECQICGKNISPLIKVEVEGAIIEVCEKCIKFGTRIVPQQAYQPIKRKIEVEKLKENELVTNYGELIKKYRESKGLTREEFAKRIGERESVIKRIEEEKLEPTEELTKRIENFLKIKLTQEISGEIKYKEEKKRPKLTVGDVVEVR